MDNGYTIPDNEQVIARVAPLVSISLALITTLWTAYLAVLRYRNPGSWRWRWRGFRGPRGSRAGQNSGPRDRTHILLNIGAALFLIAAANDVGAVYYGNQWPHVAMYPAWVVIRNVAAVPLLAISPLLSAQRMCTLLFHAKASRMWLWRAMVLLCAFAVAVTLPNSIMRASDAQDGNDWKNYVIGGVWLRWIILLLPMCNLIATVLTMRSVFKIAPQRVSSVITGSTVVSGQTTANGQQHLAGPMIASPPQMASEPASKSNSIASNLSSKSAAPQDHVRAGALPVPVIGGIPVTRSGMLSPPQLASLPRLPSLSRMPSGGLGVGVGSLSRLPAPGGAYPSLSRGGVGAGSLSVLPTGVNMMMSLSRRTTAINRRISMAGTVASVPMTDTAGAGRLQSALRSVLMAAAVMHVTVWVTIGALLMFTEQIPMTSFVRLAVVTAASGALVLIEVALHLAQRRASRSAREVATKRFLGSSDELPDSDTDRTCSDCKPAPLVTSTYVSSALMAAMPARTTSTPLGSPTRTRPPSISDNASSGSKAGTSRGSGLASSNDVNHSRRQSRTGSTPATGAASSGTVVTRSTAIASEAQPPPPPPPPVFVMQAASLQSVQISYTTLSRPTQPPS